MSPNDQAAPKDTAITTDRSSMLDAVVAGHEVLMRRLAEARTPEFLEVAVSMPQAKLLHLLGAGGELHMSEVVARLGVSLSTVSGLVDRVVDQGLATRREDPADRRQVLVGLTPEGVAFVDRFRDLNTRQLLLLLEQLDDTALAVVRAGMDALAGAAARLAELRPVHPRKEPA